MRKAGALEKLQSAFRRKLGLEYGCDIGENRAARAAYQGIVGQDPDRALSRADRKMISDYARTVLGSQNYAPWLEFYTAFNGRFREGWISENYLERYYTAKISGPFRVYASRTMSRRLVQTDTLPDIAYRIRGRYYDADWTPIPEDKLLVTIFRDHPRVVFKRDLTFRGQGVSLVDRQTFEARAAATSSDFSIQRLLRQHAVLRDISPTAAATLRLNTLRGVDGKERLCSAYFRLGGGGDEVVKHLSQIRLAIDLDSGITSGSGYTSNWTKTPVHPDTGASLEGIAVPQFTEAVSLVERLHASIPHIPYIGWDVCITQNEGPMLFEVNANRPGSSIVQGYFGPVFAGTGIDRLHL